LAFLRFSRDKRGVENFYLVQPTTNRRGKVKPRVLYWFRSPPDVKMGREPFDAEVRRALECQNPDVTFDWRAIVETPIPSADADKWRERRRAERAAKYAAAAEELEAPELTAGDEPDETAASIAEATLAPSLVIAAPSTAAPTAPAQGAPASGDANRKRRRRRRGGGGRGSSAPAPAAPPIAEPSGD
jgi:hypothetical protein